MGQYYTQENLIEFGRSIPYTSYATGISLDAQSVETIYLPREFQNYELASYMNEIIEYHKQAHQQKFGDSLSKLYNGSLIRLTSIGFVSGRLYLRLQDSSFYQSLLTNFSLDVPGIFPFDLRQKFAPPPSLPVPEKSLLSNQIGVDCLLQTSDNKLILTRRSNQTFTEGGKWNATVGGYMKNRATYFQEGVPDLFKTIGAHWSEEIGLDEAYLTDLKLIGMTRNLLTGGHFNFTLIGRCSLDFAEFQETFKTTPATDKWEISGIRAVDIAGDSTILWDFVTNNHDLLSEVLISNLFHFYNYLQRFGT